MKEEGSSLGTKGVQTLSKLEPLTAILQKAASMVPWKLLVAPTYDLDLPVSSQTVQWSLCFPRLRGALFLLLHLRAIGVLNW